MIRENKQRQSISSLQAIIIVVRKMAYDKASYEDISSILDMTEYLPTLMLDQNDKTEEFLSALIELTDKYEGMHWALELFNAD